MSLQSLKGEGMRLCVEGALERGQLWTLMGMKDGKAKYWKLRRNGQTQLWKTRPLDFRIPVSFGFRGHGEVTHNMAIGFRDDVADFLPPLVVSSEDPSQ